MTINIKNKILAREMIKDIISRIKAVSDQGYQCQVFIIDHDQKLNRIIQRNHITARFLYSIYFFVFNKGYQIIIKSNLAKRIQ